MFDKEEKKPVYIGSDHAGFEDKNKLKVYLDEKGYHVVDLGCFTPEPCDYPDIAREVGEKVLEVPDSQGGSLGPPEVLLWTCRILKAVSLELPEVRAGTCSQGPALLVTPGNPSD